MVFAFNGDALFTNKIAAVGDVILLVIEARQIYPSGPAATIIQATTGPAIRRRIGAAWLAYLAKERLLAVFDKNVVEKTYVALPCALVQRLLFRLGGHRGTGGR